MRFSQLFTKTRHEAPKDEVSKNAELLLRAGFIHKEMAGVYSYLPLGFRVLKNIERIIRREMNAIGASELILTALQAESVWQKTGRWDDEAVQVWFKSRLKNDVEVGLGFTHDEQLVNLLTEYVHSYRDLPLYLYQIQTKFRNELRAKSGIMRGREFVMKDLYSFNRTEEEQDEYYAKVQEAYWNIFEACGIADKTYLTFASGGTFSKYSHEFQALSEAGEDTIYIDEERGIAVNKEVYTDEVLSDLGLTGKDLVEKKAIEVANIFKQGTKFTDPYGMSFIDEQGSKRSVIMGGYGIGVTRLMGTVVELLSDDQGIVWPEEIAPFRYHLLSLGRNEEVKKRAEKVYQLLEGAGVEVLYDDRDESTGVKFADADLIGIPNHVIVGERALEGGEGIVELKDRRTREGGYIHVDELLKV
ncbi:MAG: prolyl-tRNA synthetase [Parcubacteria group bacterium]|nr:prolyl-tRNA synthetase [Parcubacteria group bacterium]